MNTFLLITALILAFCGTLIIIILGIIGTYLIIVGRFMRFSPPVPSSGQVKKAILKDAAQYLAQHHNLTIVDLGSGWGTLLLPLAKQFPQHNFVGYELSKLPYFISCWRARFSKNLHFIYQDFFSADLTSANVIFCFLLPSAMQHCQDDIIPHLAPNTRLYANRFALPDTTPLYARSFGSAYETYYVYKF